MKSSNRYFAHFSFLILTRITLSFQRPCLWPKRCQQKWLLSLLGWHIEFLMQTIPCSRFLRSGPWSVALRGRCHETEAAWDSELPHSEQVLWRDAQTVGHSEQDTDFVVMGHCKAVFFILQCSLIFSGWHKISSVWG